MIDEIFRMISHAFRAKLASAAGHVVDGPFLVDMIGPTWYEALGRDGSEAFSLFIFAFYLWEPALVCSR